MSQAETALASEAPPKVGVRRDKLAPETVRLYTSDWRRFAAHCAAIGVTSLPADPATVIGFLETPGPGRAALARRVAAIDHRHRQIGLAAPGDQFEVRAALRRACKPLPRRTRAPPPAPPALRQMAQRCPGNLAGRRDRAVLLLLAAGLGRRDIVRLQTELIRFTERGLATRLGERAVELERADPANCPVRALEAWFNAASLHYGPAFRKINRWGALEFDALGADAVRLILARRCAPPGG